MAEIVKLKWGLPYIYVALTGGTGLWLSWPKIVQGTAQLTTEEGNLTEAIAEGGEVIATRRDKSKYTFECEVFASEGLPKPIEDDDGVILDTYSIRLIPEDRRLTGWIMESASVSCVTTWSAENGERWKYTFKGLKPEVGKILKPYKALVLSPEKLAFSKSADTTGKTVAVSGTVTAASSETWATATVAANVVTVKVTANSGAARKAYITVSTDDKSEIVEVTQAAGA
jgi:hypothetical protein